MKHLGKIVSVLAGCMLLASPAMAAEKVRWKCAMTWPSTLTPLASAAPRLSKLVGEMTGGTFEIKVEGAEKHKAPQEILDMVKGGQFEMGHTASYYWKGKDITTVFFTSVPFGMTADEQYAWLYYGGGQQLQEKVYSKFGVYSFPGGNTGVQMGGWFRKEIKTLDDLKGLKMRIPGLAGEVFAKLGVNVVNIPPGELYTSLERGTVDALEWVGPGMDIKMGFHKIAPFYYAGWHEPASDMQFLVNKAQFAKLSPEYQAILKTAMQAVVADLTYDNTHENSTAWAQMKQEFPNIKVMIFPDEILKAMKKANDEVMQAYAAQNPEFKEVYESQQAYLKKAREYSRISTENYLKTTKMVE